MFGQKVEFSSYYYQHRWTSILQQQQKVAPNASGLQQASANSAWAKNKKIKNKNNIFLFIFYFFIFKFLFFKETQYIEQWSNERGVTTNKMRHDFNLLIIIV